MSLNALLFLLCVWGLSLGGAILFLRRVLPLVQAWRRGTGTLSDWRSGESPIRRLALVWTSLTGRLGTLPRALPGIGHLLVVFSFVVTLPYTFLGLCSDLFPFFPLAQGWVFASSIRTVLTFASVMGLCGAGLLAIHSSRKKSPENERILRHFRGERDWKALCVALGSVYAIPLFVAAVLISALAMMYWGGSAWHLAHTFAFWGFVSFWPRSSHTHLLAAPVSLFSMDRASPRHMRVTDFSDEEAESFGLGHASALERADVVQVFSCTNCRRCEEVCPALQAGLPLSPRNVIVAARAAWEAMARGGVSANATLVQAMPEFGQVPASGAYMRIVHERAAKGGLLAPEALWACTSCGSCEEACSVGIRHLDFVQEERKYQVLTLAEAPEGIHRYFSNMEQTANPFGFGDMWAAPESPPADSFCDPGEADVFIFAGAFTRSHPDGHGILNALWKLTGEARQRPVLVDASGSGLDTGDDIRRAGNEYLARQFSDALQESLGTMPHGIVSPCPHTVHAFRNELPQLGIHVSAEHHSQYLLDCIESGRFIPQAQSRPLRVLYHDPCYLGRRLGDYDAPREVIRRCNNGVRPVEFAESRDLAFCCGGGGGMQFVETVSLVLAGRRLSALLAHQPDVIVTGCPTCKSMLNEAKKALSPIKDPLPPIIDLAEFCLYEPQTTS